MWQPWCDPTNLMTYFPEEVLSIIFLCLPAKSMIICRAVCIMWRDVIDNLSRNDNLWRRSCLMDFGNLYEAASRKSKYGVTWFHLYRSLSVWKLLMNAAQKQHKFVATVTSPLTDIRSFSILNNGIVGILQDRGVTYYDIETLSVADLPPLLGDYTRYSENDRFVVVLSTTLHLHIMRKKRKHKMNEITHFTYYNVKQFSLIDKKLFFVSCQDEIFVCNLRYKILQAKFMARSLVTIKSIGYSDGELNVLTLDRQILALVKHTFVMRASLDMCPNLIQQLETYHLNNMDCRVYFQWLYELNQEVPDGPLKNATVVKHYGDVCFVGFYWGELRIYYSTQSSGELDVMTSTLMKQYNFAISEDRTPEELCMCPILQVDVIEETEGHTVIVAMPKNIAVLKFKHDFEFRISGQYEAVMPGETSDSNVSDEELSVPGPSGQN